MHSFKPAARRRGRMPRFLLLSLLILATGGINPAHADGVSDTISNGKTVTGKITGSGVDSYTFKVEAGGSFVVSVGETGTHDKKFLPAIDLTGPGSKGETGSARSLHAGIEKINAAAGTWTVKVSRADTGSATDGNYALTLVQVPGAGTAVALSPGKDYSGSNERGTIDAFTFTGVAGHTETLKLNATGGIGFAPEISVFTPAGGFSGAVSCITSCSQDVPIKADGTWTVLVSKSDDNDVTGKYKLSVNDKN